MTATDESTDVPKHLAELGEDEQGHHSVTAIRDLSIRVHRHCEEVVRPLPGRRVASFNHEVIGILDLRESRTCGRQIPWGRGEIERVRAAASFAGLDIHPYLQFDPAHDAG